MYLFEELREETAQAVDAWSYPEPYDFYDLDADPEDRALFLDPETWPDRRYAVRDGDDTLVGFVSFDPEGDTVEVGLGMAPDRTGAGEGERFVEAALNFAQETYDAEAFTLAVAAFNERAIRVYAQVGFERTETFEQETNDGVYEFVRMRLDLG